LGEKSEELVEDTVSYQGMASAMPPTLKVSGALAPAVIIQNLTAPARFFAQFMVQSKASFLLFVQLCSRSLLQNILK
jgi:hypothetical protein